MYEVVAFDVFFFQAEDGIRDVAVTGVQTCALPISKLMITPSVLLSQGAAACAQKNGARKFVSSEESQISSVVDTMLAGRKLAALFTRMSRRPNCFPASSNTRLISET